mgnify:CR=1 FL=1
MNVPTGGGRGHRRRPMAEINVVPYIDVSLVLLHYVAGEEIYVSSVGGLALIIAGIVVQKRLG